LHRTGPSLTCPDRWSGCGFNPWAPRLRGTVDLFDYPDRRPIAVVATADGRRVELPVGSDEVTPLSLIRSIIVVVESLVGLIVGGNRREIGGTPRGQRQ
jgi:hypothetical protein